MRFLIVGAANPLAKAFVKENKKRHEMIALDEKKADLSEYFMLGEVFKAYAFDAVFYFTATGGVDKTAVCTGDLTLLKNLAYAAAFHKTRLVVIADALDSFMFNRVAAGLAARDKTVTTLRVFGLIGKGLSVKTNGMMRLLSDANKTASVTIPRNYAVSLAHLDDALGAIAGFIETDMPSCGCVDLAPQKPSSLVAVARAAKRILGGEVSVIAPKLDPAPDYVGDPAPLKECLPKFKFISQNAAIERVLGNV